jgi:hypothetical protein
MSTQDLVNGLEDAADLCEQHTTKNQWVLGCPYASQSTFDLKRAIESCRLAARLLKESQVLERFQREQAEKRRTKLMADFTPRKL